MVVHLKAVTCLSIAATNVRTSDSRYTTLLKVQLPLKTDVPFVDKITPLDKSRIFGAWLQKEILTDIVNLGGVLRPGGTSEVNVHVGVVVGASFFCRGISAVACCICRAQTCNEQVQNH